MPTIAKGSELLTLINIFTVEPANQQELVDLLVEATRTSVRHVEGFVSASLHRSLDGTTVAMYAQWRSIADYQAMRGNPTTSPYMQKALALARFELGLYEVVETFTPALDAERTSPAGMKWLRATGSVDASFARLEAAVAQRGLTVFARIDFAADAAAVGLTLRPTRLLQFGNPRAGTPLIAAAPSVALDLPLKVLVREADDGTVWVGYTTPEYLAERHAVPTELLAGIRPVEALAAIAAGTA